MHWEWHTGKGWTKIPGSEASGANGLEISKDGKTLYGATWGNQAFFRLSLGQAAVKRDDIKLGFRADNVRWSPDGERPEGHVETEPLAWGHTPEEATERVGALSLYDVKAALDEAIGRAPGAW